MANSTYEIEIMKTHNTELRDQKEADCMQLRISML